MDLGGKDLCCVDLRSRGAGKDLRDSLGVDGRASFEAGGGVPSESLISPSSRIWPSSTSGAVADGGPIEGVGTDTDAGGEETISSWP